MKIGHFGLLGSATRCGGSEHSRSSGSYGSLHGLLRPGLVLSLRFAFAQARSAQLSRVMAKSLTWPVEVA